MTTTTYCTTCSTRTKWLTDGLCSGCCAAQDPDRNEHADDRLAGLTGNPGDCACGLPASCKGICFRCAYNGPVLHKTWA